MSSYRNDKQSKTIILLEEIDKIRAILQSNISKKLNDENIINILQNLNSITQNLETG